MVIFGDTFHGLTATDRAVWILWFLKSWKNIGMWVGFCDIVLDWMVIPSLLRHEAILWQVFLVKSFRQYAAAHGLERNVPGLPNRSHGIWLDSLALCLRSQETLSVRDWALGFGLSSEAQERIQKGKLAEHRDLASRMQRQASPSNHRWVRWATLNTSVVAQSKFLLPGVILLKWQHAVDSTTDPCCCMWNYIGCSLLQAKVEAAEKFQRKSGVLCKRAW